MGCPTLRAVTFLLRSGAVRSRSRVTENHPLTPRAVRIYKTGATSRPRNKEWPRFKGPICTADCCFCWEPEPLWKHLELVGTSAPLRPLSLYLLMEPFACFSGCKTTSSIVWNCTIYVLNVWHVPDKGSRVQMSGSVNLRFQNVPINYVGSQLVFLLQCVSCFVVFNI